MKKRSAPSLESVTEAVADDVIAMLEHGETSEADFKGVVKNPALSVPRNAITQRPYAGFNVVRAMLAMMRKGTADGRFCTVAKAREYAGEKVFPFKGSTATRLMRPVTASTHKNQQSEENDDRGGDQPRRFSPQEVALGDDGEPGNEKSVIGFKPFPIFHVSELSLSELEPFCPPPLDPCVEVTSHEMVRHLVAAAGARVEPGASPCFIPGSPDRPDGVISMPLASDYESPDSWAADMLHEFYHWTGVPSRQNRFSHLDDDLSPVEAERRFADEYAIEEVRAELFASLAGRLLGLEYDVRQHASYIDFWSGKAAVKDENLEDSPENRSKMIRSVIQDVGPIIAGLNAFMLGEVPSLKWFRDPEQWPEDTRAYFASLGVQEAHDVALEGQAAEAETPLNIPPALAASFAEPDDAHTLGDTPPSGGYPSL